MADLSISNSLKKGKEEILLGDIEVNRGLCNGEEVQVHGLLANDLSVRLANGTVVPLMQYIGDNGNVLANSLQLVGNTNIEIEENRPIGTFITNLGATGGSSPYTFSVQDQRFQIQSNRLESGHIFDFETESSPILLDIKVTDSVGDFTVKPYSVNIIDVAGEVQPIIITATPPYSVLEHSVNGTLVGSVAISGGIAPYTTALNDTSKFYVQNNGNIYVNGDIEYDDASTIAIQLSVEDSSGLTASTMLSINITEDAVVPLSLSAPATATVDEHSAIGTTVATATASNGTAPYTYSIANPAFNISNAGVITVAQDLEHDTDPTVSIVVSVSDSAAGTATANMVITVSEVINMTMAVTSGFLDIDEHLAVGSRPVLVTTSGGTGPYTYSCATTNPVTIVENAGNSATFEFEITADIEYDTTTSVPMSVTVTDTNGATATQVFTFNIQEVVIPVFSVSIPATATVTEHAPLNTHIATAVVSNGTAPFLYSLAEPHFNISNTGVISVGSDIEYDDDETINITVVVTDDEGETATDSMVITIEEIPGEFLGYSMSNPSINYAVPNETRIATTSTNGGSTINLSKVTIDAGGVATIQAAGQVLSTVRPVTGFEISRTENNRSAILCVNNDEYAVLFDSGAGSLHYVMEASDEYFPSVQVDGGADHIIVASTTDTGHCRLRYLQIDSNGSILSSVTGTAPDTISGNVIATATSHNLDAGKYATAIVTVEDAGVFTNYGYVLDDASIVSLVSTEVMTHTPTMENATQYSFAHAFSGVYTLLAFGRSDGIQIYKYLRDGTLDSTFGLTWNSMLNKRLAFGKINGNYVVMASNQNETQVTVADDGGIRYHIYDNGAYIDEMDYALNRDSDNVSSYVFKVADGSHLLKV